MNIVNNPDAIVASDKEEIVHNIYEERSAFLRNGFKPTAVWSAYAENRDYRDTLGRKTGGTSAGKAPYGDDWLGTARARIGTVWSEAINLAHANTGIVGDNLRVVDSDVDDPHQASQVMAAIEYYLGTPVTMRVRAGSSRFLIPYRAAEGSPPKERDAVGKHQAAVEILGNGNQFVASALHCKLRPIGEGEFERVVTEIEWHPKHITEVHRDELPAVTDQQIADFRRAVRTILGIPEPSIMKNVFVHDPNTAFVDPTDADLAAIVDLLPAPLADDYDTWLWTVSALRNASGGSSFGYHLAQAFSAKSTYYNKTEVDKKWRSPTRHDFSYLIGKARAADPTFLTPSFAAKTSAAKERAFPDAIARKRWGGSRPRRMDLDF
jgi:hypothetical protein